MEALHYTNMDSPIGPLFLAASAQGLVALEFDARLPGQQSIRPNPRDLREEKKGFQFEQSSRALQAYISEIEEYFTGNRRQFTFPLDLRGTDFQLACWRALPVRARFFSRCGGRRARQTAHPRREHNPPQNYS
jgi:O6-methylguanine-DNA--protein-cysteine methyltransferase